MRLIIADQKERVGEWVLERVGQGSKWVDYEAVGIEKDGELIAGVVFDNYVKDTRCMVHCAGDGKRWLSREFLFVVFDYVFRQLNCRVAISPVNSENIASVTFISHIGFDEKCRIEKGSPGGDLVVFTLYREKCRWLKYKMKGSRHGQRS